jgi:hypothetical protein
MCKTPDFREQVLENLGVLGGLFIIGMTSFLILLEYNILSFNPRNRVLNFTTIFQALGSLLLTLALVILYNSQTTIAENQQEVQESQQKIMKSNHRPLIDIDEVFPGHNSEQGYTDSLELTLSAVLNRRTAPG